MSLDSYNYYGDSRVRAGERRNSSPIQRVDDKRMVATVLVRFYEDDERTEAEETHDLPVVFAVCPTCDGRGKHVNPSIDAGGLSSDVFEEDPDFAEDYVRGVYDVTCYECRGMRVAPELDRDRIDPAIIAALDAMEQADRDYRAEVAAERRMGC